MSINENAGTALTLTERSLSAVKWNYAGVIAKVLAQFAIGIALARVLGPKPFGVYSAVLLVTGIGSLLVERGLGSALIQARELNDEMIRFVFTRLLATGLGVAAALYASAHVMAAIFRYPELVTAIYGSAVYLLVYAISVVPGALLQRELELKSYQIAQLVAYFVGYAGIGVSFALLGFGAWSLIAALITQMVVFAVIAYARVKHSLLPLFRLNTQRLTAFGNLVVATNLLNWTIENVDKLMVGRIYGMHALGLYAVSYNMVRNPINYVVTTVQSVLFPAGARAQENIKGLQKAYLTALGAVLLVACPIFLGIAAAAPTVVRGIYGGKWAGAEALLLPFALAIPVHACMTGSALLWARGEVGTELKVEAGTAIIFLGALAWSTRISIEGVAWAVLVVYLIRTGWLTSKILQSMRLSWAAFFNAARGGVLLGAVTAIAVYLVDNALAAHGMNPLSRLAVVTAVGLFIATVLPVCTRGLITSAELRALLDNLTPRSPGVLRSVMRLYARG